VVVLPQVVVAPTVIPQAPPAEADPSPPAASGDAASAPGEVPAVPGGVAGAPVDAAELPMEFDARMTHPEKISGPDPRYTPQALDREVEGTMVVRCVVTAEGDVRLCRVAKGLPYMDAAVVEALERRRYRPATLGGRPVDVDYVFRITLRLP
jgi:protein TonB